MSRAWSGGSTRAWRELRLWVLNRDGWRCRMEAEDGSICGRQLRPKRLESDPRHQATVQHLDPVGEGHPKLPDPDRLVAACATHNSREGAQAVNASRTIQRGWSW